MTATTPDFPRRPRGFTLVEMLVVLGIIFVVLLIAIPSFSALSGGRSTEAGQNVAAAAVTRARAEAIRRGVTVGALFYPDVDGRTAVAFVALGEATLDPDPYDQYKALVTGPDVAYAGFALRPPDNNAAPPMLADKFIALGADTAFPQGYGGYANRPVVLTYAMRSNVGTDNTPVRNTGQAGAQDMAAAGAATAGVRNVRTIGSSRLAGGPSGFSPATSFAVHPSALTVRAELLADVPGERLPPGVGLQVITGQSLDTDAGLNAALAINSVVGFGGGPDARYQDNFRDRYVRVGLIAFDRSGQLLRGTYELVPGGAASALLGLDAAAALNRTPHGNNSSLRNSSGFPAAQLGVGLVVYRQDQFESAGADGTARVWQGNFFASVAADAPLTDFFTSESDPSQPFPDFNIAPAPGGDGPDSFQQMLEWEYAEERWLDANATPQLVNRFSGTLSSNRGAQNP